MSLILAAGFVAACTDAPTGPSSGLPADTAHGAHLLLPWSDLSGHIAYITADSVQFIDAVTRQTRALASRASNETFIDVAISPEATRAAVLSQLPAGLLRSTLLRTTDGVALSTLNDLACPRWLRDGRFSYTAGRTIYVQDAFVVLSDRELGGCPTWSADGSYFIIPLVVEAGNAIYRIGVSNPARVKLLDPQPGASWYDPVISPDGKTMALVSASAAPENEIWIANVDGTQAHKLTQWLRFFEPSWSPDGKQLLGTSTAGIDGNYASAGLLLINTTTGVVRKLVNHPVYAAAWAINQ